MQQAGRANREKKRSGKRIWGLGVGLFALSLLLPAWSGFPDDSPFPGWACAWSALIVLMRCLTHLGEWVSWQVLGFNIGNALALGSPFLRNQPAKTKRWIGIAFLLSMLNAFTLHGSEHGLLIGYYVWALSFGAMGVGYLRMAKENSLSAGQASADDYRTMEDEVAERKARYEQRGVKEMEIP